jgi:hypothetical protein
MTTRSRRQMVHFAHPFRIQGIDRLLARDACEVVTDGKTGSVELSDAQRDDASAAHE